MSALQVFITIISSIFNEASNNIWRYHLSLLDVADLVSFSETVGMRSSMMELSQLCPLIMAVVAIT